MIDCYSSLMRLSKTIARYCHRRTVKSAN